MKKHAFQPRFFLFLLLSGLFLLCSGCHRNVTPVTKTGFYFNTVISITLYDSEDTELLADAFALCDSYEKTFSRTVEGSDVWNINHSSGKAVTVSAETADLISLALAFSELTEGAIDPTVAPLMDLWNFTSPDEKRVPEQGEIEALLPHVDYRSIQIDGTSVRLSDPKAQIDLGFLAKGYIADRLGEFLRAGGVESALINLGGNVLTLGNKPDGSAFTIGIREPFSDRNTALMQVSVSDASLVSSGTYERYFEEDGVVYHHILDPSSGYPVQNGLTGVTILSRSSAQGDGLSTSCLLLGIEKGMELIESIPDVEAVFIDSENRIYRSSGFPASIS